MVVLFASDVLLLFFAGTESLQSSSWYQVLSSEGRALEEQTDRAADDANDATDDVTTERAAEGDITRPEAVQ